MTTKDFIVRYVILKIVVGSYRVGEPIPSENKLAEQFQCTRITVRQAYNQLTEQNILTSKKGVGYFVNQSFFTRVYLPYNSLLDKRLIFQTGYVLNDTQSVMIYQIYSQTQPIGQVKFYYKKLIADCEQFRTIDEILVAITLDCNLNWLDVSESYQSVKDGDLEACHIHKITTVFQDPEETNNLTIDTEINEGYLEFKRKFIIA
ncbi:winged helix-turn-helix domain-containing protein [Ureaplasma ceti]|uniref:HTH gntR-type domain-containing protein n=1 Tax=Ureaplasma ceti TaxID=3119530 RepID=A0ABP9U7Z8_9BACT